MNSAMANLQVGVRIAGVKIEMSESKPLFLRLGAPATNMETVELNAHPCLVQTIQKGVWGPPFPCNKDQTFSNLKRGKGQ